MFPNKDMSELEYFFNVQFIVRVVVKAHTKKEKSIELELISILNFFLIILILMYLHHIIHIIIHISSFNRCCSFSDMNYNVLEGIVPCLNLVSCWCQEISDLGQVLL